MRGGPIAAVRDGDIIIIDVDERRMDVELDDATIAERIAAYEAPDNHVETGVLTKYAPAGLERVGGRGHRLLVRVRAEELEERDVEPLGLLEHRRVPTRGNTTHGRRG